MAFGSEPPSLDPGLATDTSSAFVVFNTNTPIVTLGPAPDLKPEPALAKSWDVNGATSPSICATTSSGRTARP